MTRGKVSINFVYQIAYQILLIISPLITTPYIARTLGPENNGIYAYSYNIAMYFVIFASLGIEAYGNRLVAQAKAKGEHILNNSFSSLFLMHLIVGILVTMLYFVYVFIWSREYKTIALIQSIWILATLVDINWLFFGLEEFKITVIRNFIVKILTVVSIFVFVKSKTDIWIYTLIMGLGTLISNIILWRFIKRYVKFVRVSWRDVIRHLKPLLILFLAVVATSVYRMIDKIMLGWYTDMTSLAAYEYADKMIKLVITLITALGTVMLPRISSLYTEGKEEEVAKYMNLTSNLIFIIAFALAFGLAGISEEFMPLLLGPGYESSVLLTKVLCISLPIMGWNNLIRTQVLMPKEKDKVYTTAVWAGAIVNIILNYLFIHWFGSLGAAVATVIAYAIVSFFQTYPIVKEYPIGTYLRYIFVPFISGIIMYICVRVVSCLFKIGLIGVVIEITTGAVVYLTINFAYLAYTKNEMLEVCKLKIKKMIRFKTKGI